MKRFTEYTPSKAELFIQRIFPDTTPSTSKKYVTREVLEHNRDYLKGMLYSSFRKLRRSYRELV